MSSKDDRALVLKILYKVAKGQGPYRISELNLFKSLDDLLERISDGVIQLELSDKTQV